VIVKTIILAASSEEPARVRAIAVGTGYGIIDPVRSKEDVMVTHRNAAMEVAARYTGNTECAWSAKLRSRTRDGCFFDIEPA
jgi:hypothetical protein